MKIATVGLDVAMRIVQVDEVDGKSKGSTAGSGCSRNGACLSIQMWCGFLGRRSEFLRESDQHSCGSRSGIGAQRRWRVDCGGSDRNRQAKKPERSGGWAGCEQQGPVQRE